MDDFDLDSFTRQVREAYERKLRELLPRTSLGYVSNPAEPLAGLEQKCSKSITFGDTSIKQEWTSHLPEPKAFADALAEAAKGRVESSTVADKDFEPAPRVFVLHKTISRNALPGQAQQALDFSEYTCVFGQLYFERTKKVTEIEFRTRYAVCQLKTPEKEDLPE